MDIMDVLNIIILYIIVPCLLVIIMMIEIVNYHKHNNYHKDNLLQNQTRDKNIQELFSITMDIKNSTNNIYSKEIEDENKKINTTVNQQLQRLLLHSNANRVGCFLYHNDGCLITGRNFQKMSMMFEQIDEKTPSIMTSCQNLPRTVYSILVQKITDQGYYYISDIKDILKIDVISYNFFASRNVKSVFIQGLIDDYKNILGFVIVEYIDKDCLNVEDLKTCLTDKTNKIMNILENNNISIIDN